MKPLNEIKDLAPKEVWDGVLARVVEGEKITLSVVELDPDTLVPEHAHVNEQIGIVITGSIRFTIGGETQEFGSGGSWRILANVPHEAQAGSEGAVVVEVFSPIRTDWHDIRDLTPRQPRWPSS